LLKAFGRLVPGRFPLANPVHDDAHLNCDYLSEGWLRDGACEEEGSVGAQLRRNSSML